MVIVMNFKINEFEEVLLLDDSLVLFIGIDERRVTSSCDLYNQINIFSSVKQDLSFRQPEFAHFAENQVPGLPSRRNIFFL